MSLAIDLPMEGIRTVARRHGVRRLSVFGSILGNQFSNASDVDLLVEFIGDDFGPWMGKLTSLREELAQLTGRSVDLVPPESLRWQIRDQVLAEAVTIYEV